MEIGHEFKEKIRGNTEDITKVKSIYVTLR